MSKNHDKDVAFIQALADMLNASDLTELEVERGEDDGDSLKIRLSRATVAPAALPVQAAAPVQSTATSAAPSAAAPIESSVASPSGPDLSNAVTSPMVGTVYLAPEPGAAQFVSAGDEVQEGQTILIIEAMKTMNQIPAPRSGRVKTIMVENAEPVEFGEPLLIIE
jgi:acetyl-CoA carboxylase biotin carboxyl carrier protein